MIMTMIEEIPRDIELESIEQLKKSIYRKQCEFFIMLMEQEESIRNQKQEIESLKSLLRSS